MNWQPHLIGTLLELRPLREEDWPALYQAASDPLIWEQHPAHDRYQEPVFRDFFDGALASRGAFVVIDRATQAVVGSSRYHAFDAAKSEVEIGWTFLARSHWGGTYNREMKRLMLDHAFQYVDRVLFLVGEHNLRSRKAVEKLGAILTGQREATLNGKLVIHVVYELGKQAWASRP